MFEKHRNVKQEPLGPAAAEPHTGAAAPTNQSASGRIAFIGPGIHINGDISGEENLVVEGKVDGKIRLENHQVEIGRGGRVNANVSAKVIKIAGEVRGDLKGKEKVVISSTGNVQGNIVAPRMTLEDGAIFKGSIDMDPGEGSKPAVVKPGKNTAEKSTDKPVDQNRMAAPEKSKESGTYSLNGS